MTESIAAASPSVNSTPARYCGAFTGGLGQLELGPRDGAAEAQQELVVGQRDAHLLVRTQHGRRDHLRADGREIDDGRGVAVELELDAGADAEPRARGACRASRAPCGASAVATGAADALRRGGRASRTPRRPPAARLVAVGFTTWRV